MHWMKNTLCLSYMIYYIVSWDLVFHYIWSPCNIIHLTLTKNPKSPLALSLLLGNTNTSTYLFALTTLLALPSKSWNIYSMVMKTLESTLITLVYFPKPGNNTCKYWKNPQPHKSHWIHGHPLQVWMGHQGNQLAWMLVPIGLKSGKIYIGISRTRTTKKFPGQVHFTQWNYHLYSDVALMGTSTKTCFWWIRKILLLDASNEPSI